MFASPQIWIPQPKKIVAAVPTWTKTHSAGLNLGTVSHPATHTNCAVNNSSTSDVIIVHVATTQGGPTTSVTIGGDAMTKAIGDSANSDLSTWYITGHTYSTPSIVCDQSTNIDDSLISVGVLQNCPTLGTAQVTAIAFTGDPHTTSAITIPSTGFGLVAGFAYSSTGSGTFNVGTKDYDINGSTGTLTTGYISTSGSQTPSISGWNGFFFSMTATPWGP